MKRFLASILVLNVFLASSGHAQQNSVSVSVGNGGGGGALSWSPSGHWASLGSVGTTAANVALPSGQTFILVTNYGSSPVTIQQGTSTAPSGFAFNVGEVIPPGLGVIYPVTGTNLWAIVASGVTNLQISGGVPVSQPTTTTPAATGGWTPIKVAALSTTPVTIKPLGGQLGLVNCGSSNASQTFVQVFNTTSITLGTTASFPIPIGPFSAGGFTMASAGLQFSTAIAVAATTTATGSTGPAIPLDCTFGFN